ncbi:cation diffusion facilitator family transporter [Sinanaerobacter sp. ZZT-01]|uniref:cation diffusion facilitator family transporter n=1 Tax=Sinanaerobacter sp. ZZT-01 TaxID=3111540 RepID=UPI002D764DCD|nr:cation diffusion facilitator family transporter [Sinanaerobacter sp. ZZT-01]WRR94726.1 cation diffusion facilitator family transporter [Sinanaerobacter sp. ZZT-01]
MRKLLIKVFIKDYENIRDPHVRESYGKLAGVIGIVSNAFLCTLKILTGLLFHSIAILADGINNLADASSSFITLIGFRLASRPADEEHPYGHARIEYLTGVIVSVLIIVLGVQLCMRSFDKILHPDPLDFNYFTIGILIVSILIKIWQSLFNIKMGEIISSSTLKATGTDSRNDVIATSAVLFGILIGKATNLQLDGYLGMLVALFIIYSGFQLVKETADPLLGQAPDPELVNAISEKIMKHPDVLGVHDLVVHNYGPARIFASVHVEVDAHNDMIASHDMIDNLERTLSESLRIHLVVHMDPVDYKDPLTQIVKQQLKEIITEYDTILDIHDIRVVHGYTHHNVIFDVVISPQCSMSEEELKSHLAKDLQLCNPLYQPVITIDKNYTGDIEKH